MCSLVKTKNKKIFVIVLLVDINEFGQTSDFFKTLVRPYKFFSMYEGVKGFLS